MKIVNFLKNAMKISVLAALLCVLPIFAEEASASTLPLGVEITTSEGSDAVSDVDYKFDNYTLEIYKNDLTINGDGCEFSACITDKISESCTHHITIKNITLKSGNTGSAIYFGTDNDAILFVKGCCSIIYYQTGLTYKHSLTIKGGSETTLDIRPINPGTGEYYGIYGEGLDSSQNIWFEGSGENIFKVTVEAYLGHHTCHGISSENGGGTLSVAENAEVTFKGSSDDDAGFVAGYGQYVIYGKLVVDNGGRGPAFKINAHSTFITDKNTEIFLRTKEGPAITNEYEDWFADEKFGSKIKTVASDQYTDDYSAITGGLKIDGLTSGNPGKSYVLENNNIAKSVLIKAAYNVEFDGFEGSTEKCFKGFKAQYPNLAPDDPHGGKFNDKWYVNKDYDTAWDFDDAVNENMKLYPGFLYTVEFDTAGGKEGPKAAEVLINHSLDKPEDPAKDGEVFGYWSADENKPYGEAAKWDFQTVINKNMTLYAKWVIKSYAVNVASAKNGTVKADKDKASKGDTVTLTITPKEGYKVDTVSVVDADKNAVKVKDNKFTMPDNDVTVSVTFIASKNNVELVSAKASGKRTIKLSWAKVKGATDYVVYGGKYGSKLKKIKTTKSTSLTVKKLDGKKLKANTEYIFYVVAKTPNEKVKSNSIHLFTANSKGEYGNVTSIKAKYSKVNLKVGKTKKLGATMKIYKNKKHIPKTHGAALRYTSDNPSVAKVNSKGKVTAVSKGTATIYIQDIGGMYCKTKVTVK